LLGSAAAEEQNLPTGPDRADYVVVDKSDRKLYLYKAGRVLREFDVSLGQMPNGPKQREGDFRTPEGKYFLDDRNVNSDYFLSIHVSYPNDQDRARARAQGRRPGRANHDSRIAQRAPVRRTALSGHRLDGWLHSRQQLGHGRHLAHDPRIDSHRDSPLGSFER
jgi:L,D-transpeptidase-like protein